MVFALAAVAGDCALYGTSHQPIRQIAAFQFSDVVQQGSALGLFFVVLAPFTETLACFVLCDEKRYQQLGDILIRAELAADEVISAELTGLGGFALCEE